MSLTWATTIMWWSKNYNKKSDTMATVETQATQKERKQHTDMLRKTDSKLSMELGKRDNITVPTQKEKE